MYGKKINQHRSPAIFPTADAFKKQTKMSKIFGSTMY
jgi:hypothetical protein